MRILIVGAGATGGYLGTKLLAAQRDVTFLVRDAAKERLNRDGLRIRASDGSVQTTTVQALTRSALRDRFEVIIVAVRAAAVAGALTDCAAAVGDQTTIVPVANGIGHLDLLRDGYGSKHACGGVATLAVSMDQDGVLDEVRPAATLEIGPLQGGPSERIAAVARLLDVDGLRATVSDDIVTAMWSKFAFITSMAIPTCLLQRPIGPIARTPGGRRLAEAVLAEVSDVAAADAHPLTDTARTNLHARLTDGESTFGPSMYRDLVAGRPVETDVLAELADRARRHDLTTPLLDAALVALALHHAEG
jgi:2-dehydropantoate 2-reductase